MKVRIGMAALVLAAAVGCGTQTVSQPASKNNTAATPAADSQAAASTDTTLVTLKLPGMTWGGCAASVRGDLSKVEGVSDIETDIPSRICKFKLEAGKVDIKGKLEELSKTNDHIAGYSIESDSGTP